MSRGGYRPNSGPKKGTKYRPRASKDGAVKQRRTGTPRKSMDIPADIAADAAAENLTPLEYMLRVMNNPESGKERRDRMAVAAAPFIHPRKGEGAGKKEEKDNAAKKAGSGKFAAGAPPKLAVVKQ